MSFRPILEENICIFLYRLRCITFDILFETVHASNVIRLFFELPDTIRI